MLYVLFHVPYVETYFYVSHFATTNLRTLTTLLYFHLTRAHIQMLSLFDKKKVNSGGQGIRDRGLSCLIETQKSPALPRHPRQFRPKNTKFQKTSSHINVGPNMAELWLKKLCHLYYAGAHPKIGKLSIFFV